MRGDCEEFVMQYPCHSPLEKRWFNARITRFQGGSGNIVVSHENVTLQKIAEQNLANNEAKFRQFIETSLEGIAIINSNGIITEWNRAMETLTGIRREEAINQTMWDIQWSLTPPEKKTEGAYEKIKNFTLSLLDETAELHSSIEGFIYSRAGELKNILQSSFAFPSQQGRQIGTVIRDITEIKSMQAKLEKSLATYRLLTENSSDGVTLINGEGRLEYASPAYLNLLGYPEEDVIGKKVQDLISARIHPQDREKIIEVMNTAREQKLASSVYEFRALQKNGEYVWIEDFVRREFDERGNVLRSIINSRQITERKYAEQQLEIAYQTARILMEAETLKEAAPKILQTICERMGWKWGELWGMDKDNDLRCIGLWHEPSSGYLDMVTATRQISNLPGRGMPGLIWENQQPIWINDISQENRFMRAPVAMQAGLKSGLGFPVIHNNKTLNVMLFLTDTALKPNNILLDTFSSIGIQIGLFVQRKQAEERIRESERDLKESQKIAHMGRWKLDHHTNTLYWSEEVFNMFEIDPSQFGANYEAFLATVHPEDREMVNQLYTDSLKGLVPYEIEHRLLMPDGRVKWMLEICNTDFDEDGHPIQSIGIVQDITQRKQAEEEVKSNEARYRGLFTNAHDAILIADDSGRYVDVNPKACSLLGYTREELLQKSIWDITPGASQEAGQKMWKEFIAAGEQSGEYQISHKNGNILIFDYHAVANILPGLHYAVMRDITEETRIKRALQDSEMRLSDVINTANDAIISVDENQIITLVNPAAETIFQYQAKDLLGKHLSALIPERYRKNNERYVREYDESKRQHRAMFGLINAVGLRADGSEFPIETSISQSKVGGKKAYTVILRDVTERKLMERKLQESETRFRELVEKTEDIIARFDLNGNITYINPSGLRVLGLDSMGEVKGKSYANFVSPETLKQIQETIAAQIANKAQNIYMEYQVISKNGAEIWLGQNTQMIFENGEFKGFQIYARNITQLKQTQESMMLSREQALKASQLKSQLIAKVSHKLRTPLSSVLGFAELLKYNIFGELNEQQMEAAEQIVDSAHYLTGMVNEFLDEAEIESKTMTLDHKPFQPAEILKHVENTMKVIADKKGLALQTYLAPDVPETLWGDPRRLQQIMINLSSNAIKFTRAGEVSISILRHTADHWSIQVKDTGVGIAPEAQELIFEPFRQIDNAITRENQGTGLGLTITKQLVELMNGRIFVESHVGKGSTFTAILPIESAPKPKAERKENK